MSSQGWIIIIIVFAVVGMKNSEQSAETKQVQITANVEIAKYNALEACYKSDSDCSHLKE